MEFVAKVIRIGQAHEQQDCDKTKRSRFGSRKTHITNLAELSRGGPWSGMAPVLVLGSTHRGIGIECLLDTC